MSRPLRIEYPGAYYHVMNRAISRRDLFVEDKDRERFLALLGEISRHWKVEIFAYCLMDNHYHLLLQTPNAGLSRAMRHLDGIYTQRFNRAHHRDGPIFRGRYKAILIDAEEYFLSVVRYVHQNPVASGIVTDVDRYRWSSHRAYLGRERIPWLSAESVLGMFHSERRVAGRAYTRFIAEGLPQGHRDDLYEVWEQRYLGDERFVERLERQVREALPKLRAITVTDILRVVAEEFGCTVKEIISYSQRRVAAQARHWVALLASEVAGERITAAAAALRRSPGSLSVGISRLRHTLLENPAEGKRLQRLSAILHQRSHPKYKKGRS